MILHKRGAATKATLFCCVILFVAHSPSPLRSRCLLCRRVFLAWPFINPTITHSQPNIRHWSLPISEHNIASWVFTSAPPLRHSFAAIHATHMHLQADDTADFSMLRSLFDHKDSTDSPTVRALLSSTANGDGPFQGDAGFRERANVTPAMLPVTTGDGDNGRGTHHTDRRSDDAYTPATGFTSHGERTPASTHRPDAWDKEPQEEPRQSSVSPLPSPLPVLSLPRSRASAHSSASPAHRPSPTTTAPSSPQYDVSAHDQRALERFLTQIRGTITQERFLTQIRGLKQWHSERFERRVG